jgi:putative ATP-binding cassette transporter
MIAAGIAAGLFSAALLAIVSRALVEGRESTSWQWLLLGFAAVAVGKIVTVAASQILVVRFAQGNVLELSLQLCRQILASPLRKIEAQRGGAILTVLTDDVTSITWAVQCLPQLATNGAVLLGCAIYLAWLSWTMFAALALVALASALVYRALYARAFVRIEAARLAKAQLLEHFRSLIDGLRELMMHRARRTEFVESELQGAAERYRRENLQAAEQYAFAEAWVQVVYFLLVGIVLFAFPRFVQSTSEALTAYVFAMLYLMNPVYAIVGSLPAVARGQVALERIASLGLNLAESGAAPTPATPGPAAADGVLIEMNQIQFRYEAAPQSEAAFKLGPLDFVLRQGELVFVVGGNGSGKTTFVKLLGGLYAPEYGEMRFAGTPITAANREWLREQVSVVFSDPFVFERFLGLARADIEAEVQRYLRLMQLDRKVTASAGAFSTTALSQGQRKRLALIVAYLEDRPIYIFDEWAADQDPDYKRVFYSQLLPELRARGKAVVVITHDDRYFALGDRVVTLEDGRVRAA